MTSLVTNRLLALHERHLRGARKERARLFAVVRVRADEVVGEPGLERDNRLEVLDVLGRELDVEGFDVVLEVLDLAAGGRDTLASIPRTRYRGSIDVHLPSHDGEDVACLGHHVRESDCGGRLDAVGLCDFVECGGDLLLVLRLFGAAHE
jgi:hypothetical protein